MRKGSGIYLEIHFYLLWLHTPIYPPPHEHPQDNGPANSELTRNTPCCIIKPLTEEYLQRQHLAAQSEQEKDRFELNDFLTGIGLANYSSTLLE